MGKYEKDEEEVVGELVGGVELKEGWREDKPEGLGKSF